MRISERITSTIDDWRIKWGEILKGFLVSFLSYGLEVFMNIIGKAFAPKLKPFIDMLEATGKVSPELKPLLDEIKSPTGQVGALLAQSAGGAVVSGGLGRILDILFLPISYSLNEGLPVRMPDETQLIGMWLRGQISDEALDTDLKRLGDNPLARLAFKELSQARLDPNSWIAAFRRKFRRFEEIKDDLKDQGLSDGRVEALKLVTETRVDPASWITAFRRKYAEFAKIEGDLKEQGWTDERIEALKFITLYMPSAAEIVHWYAREVYEPDMIDRYGLDSELPNYEETDFPKIGVDPIQARHHWMAHWEHASYMQVREMIHRGVLSLDKTMPSPPTTKEGWEARDAEGEKAAYDWYRLVEIPPFWRARLTEMMYEMPTRVDVRRWWDMRTISEERLYSIYHSRGYHGKDLDDYVLWTKVYTAWPDLIARFKNAWIGEEDVRKELKALGMPPERIEEMMQTKIKNAKPEQVAEERLATATEIMKGVKKEFISTAQGIEMLGDLGYSEETAIFKLVVYGAVTAGSPETYPEFKQMTQAYRKAMGLSAMEVPQEVIEASKEVAEARAALHQVETKERTDITEAQAQIDLTNAEYRYRQLLIKWEAEKKK